MIKNRGFTGSEQARFDGIKRAYGLQAIAKMALSGHHGESYRVVNNKNGSVFHRINSCGMLSDYLSKKTGKGRAVTISPEGKAHYSGVGACGLGWSCPVCARKLCHARRMDIDNLMRAVREKSGAVLMISFTHSHNENEKLKEKILLKAAALRSMKSDKRYKNLMSGIGYVGQVRALEVTHGANGWHPHTHELYILKEKINSDRILNIENTFYEIWRAACIKNGLGEPSREHGVKVDYCQDADGGGKIGSYLSKFGFELTNSQSKKGKAGGRNAWQLLEDFKIKKCGRSAALFREYSEAMVGRALVFFSRGLKDLYGLNDEPDENVVEDLFPDAILNRPFEPGEWGLVLEYGLHAAVLIQAEIGVLVGERDRVGRFLRHVRARDKQGRMDRIISRWGHLRVFKLQSEGV